MIIKKSLNVLEHKLRTMWFERAISLKRNQHEQQYVFKLFHILTTNIMECILHDDIKF
jgi:hypothetical protein